MAVNNTTFYATINSLVSKAAGIADAGITDYDSFIDFGRTLGSMNGSDFANQFAKEIANKIHLSIDTIRDYKGAYGSLIKGKIAPNAVIELITHQFMETRAAAFIDLVDGTSVDQWIINKGEQAVDYYIDDNSYQIPVTIQSVELEGAFQSPEAMDRFLNAKIRMALNSNESAREAGRIGLVAALIKDLSEDGDVEEAAAPEDAAQVYPLLTMFNDLYDQTLTADNAMYNGEFVKFVVNMLKKVRKKMAKPSVSFNNGNKIDGAKIKTFTPLEANKLFIHSALDSALETYVHQDVRRPEALGNFETVTCWQSEDDVFVVKYDDGTGEETTSDPVIAVMADDFAMGEYVCVEDVQSTGYNVPGKYYDVWISCQTKYVMNRTANRVIFTLA